jgi:hypothetical protein
VGRDGEAYINITSTSVRDHIQRHKPTPLPDGFSTSEAFLGPKAQIILVDVLYTIVVLCSDSNVIAGKQPVWPATCLAGLPRNHLLTTCYCNLGSLLATYF